MFDSTRSRKSPLRSRARLFLEELESRTLLSVTPLDSAVAVAAPGSGVAPQASASLDPQLSRGGSTTTGPYNPAQVQAAYGFNQLFTPSTYNANAGAGQTIAIIDAYNDATIQSDLAQFDSKFTLPGTTTSSVSNFLSVVGIDSTTGAVVDPSTFAAAAASGWDVETALDVEWAHAMAPAAKIVLVESSSANSVADMQQAVKYAAANASVVSMSWGETGDSAAGEAALEQLFQTPGVTFVAASGDSGSLGAPIYPAMSPNVVSVGGTHLVLNSSNSTISNETGWGNAFWGSYAYGSYVFGGSGGGYSAKGTEPAYQANYATSPEAKALGNTVLSKNERGTPDVAYDADPNTGFYVYDTDGGGGWYEVGGTSAGAPQWAALIALADQSRAAKREAPLSSAQTLSALYQAAGASASSYSTDFRDITAGNNGYAARSGYDLVTGLGSPKVVGVVATLTSAGAAATPAAVTVASSLTSGHAPPVATAAEAVPVSGPSSLPVITLFITPVPLAVSTTASSLAQATPSLNGSSSDSSLTSLADMAFRTVQTTAPVTNPLSQTSAFSFAVLGSPLYASRLNSASIPSMAFRASSGQSPAADAADDSEMMESSGAAGAKLAPGKQNGPSTPSQADVPAGQRREGTTACDACFADAASMSLLAEEIIGPEIGNNEESTALHSSGLVLIALWASGFWKEPASANESKERRSSLPLSLKK